MPLLRICIEVNKDGTGYKKIVRIWIIKKSTLSTPRSEARGMPSTRAQAEGLSLPAAQG